MAASPILLSGSDASRRAPIPLRAGPLTLLFEPDLAFLRYVRLGEREVLRGVYAAVRDRNWGTVRPGSATWSWTTGGRKLRADLQRRVPRRAHRLLLARHAHWLAGRDGGLQHGRRRPLDFPAKPRRLLHSPPGTGVRRSAVRGRDGGRAAGSERVPAAHRRTSRSPAWPPLRTASPRKPAEGTRSGPRSVSRATPSRWRTSGTGRTPPSRLTARPGAPLSRGSEGRGPASRSR